MAYASQAFEYKKQAVNSASPVGLVVMLYDGAIQFMELGKIAMSEKDLFAQNYNMTRAQKIIAHLMATLDMEKGGEVSANLASLYMYVYEKLISANVQDNSSFVDEAIHIFTQLRDSWATLDESLKQEKIRAVVAA